MKTKKLFLIFLFCSSISFANSEIMNKIDMPESNEFIANDIILGTCKINIYTELDNGTVIEGTVTITSEEMNVFKCAAIKFYGLFTSDY